MPETPGTPKHDIKLFYCYAREDKVLRNKLEKHLRTLKYQYRLTDWSDRIILPGENWEHAIDHHLDTSDLILLLISPDFMASDYCFGKELQRALELHDRGKTRVIPIILRHCHWREVLGKLQVLPSNAKPVKSWPDQDEAFFEITEGIRKVIDEIQNHSDKDPQPPIQPETRKTAEDYSNEGRLLHKARRYSEALTAYNHALELNPNDPYIYGGRADTYRALRKYEAGLQDLNRAFELDPDSATAWAYATRGRIYTGMKLYENALADFNRAYELEPTSIWVNKWRNETLEKLKK